MKSESVLNLRMWLYFFCFCVENLEHGGMVAVARNGKECTRRELVVNGFAWRPPRPFKLTRFRIQPTRKKHTDRVFLSSSCEPLDPACEPLDQARLHQSGRSTRIMCFFQVLVSRSIRLVSRWIRLLV